MACPKVFIIQVNSIWSKHFKITISAVYFIVMPHNVKIMSNRRKNSVPFTDLCLNSMKILLISSSTKMILLTSTAERDGNWTACCQSWMGCGTEEDTVVILPPYFTEYDTMHICFVRLCGKYCLYQQTVHVWITASEMCW